jgi:hypothetical protein
VATSNQNLLIGAALGSLILQAPMYLRDRNRAEEELPTMKTTNLKRRRMLMLSLH